MTATQTDVVLEPGARAFADATANPPYLADLGREKANNEGVIHDFVMVNALRGTNAAEDAITQATNHVTDALAASA